MSLCTNNGNRAEIAFFDVQTTIPFRGGHGYSILEFESMLVCPRKLEELDYYSTLVKPLDPNRISTMSVQFNGITREAVSSAPSFAEIADKVCDILQRRIWAGHNIIRFHCKRINEAFTEIGKTAPEPKGYIDTLQLLTQKFGRRAGDMKIATLANYFGLGQQTHRSLDVVRMNLEVVKYCATVLFLESSLTESSTEEASYSAKTDPFNMSPLSDSMSTESPQAESSRVSGSEVSTDNAEFLDPISCKEIDHPFYVMEKTQSLFYLF